MRFEGLKIRQYSQDLCVEGRVILEWLLRKKGLVSGGVHWIHMAVDKIR